MVQVKEHSGVEINAFDFVEGKNGLRTIQVHIKGILRPGEFLIRRRHFPCVNI
jgi:hypothetical protein